MTNLYSNAVSDAAAIPASTFFSQIPTRSTKTREVPVAYGDAIGYYPKFARLAGSVNAGVFLSQLWYWTQTMRTKHGDAWNGWIYKSADEWQRETGLSRDEQKTARKALAALGVLVWSKKGRVCGVLQFYLDVKVLFRLLVQMEDLAQADEQNPQSALAKTQKRFGKKAKPITENTKEISQKTQQHTPREKISQAPPENAVQDVVDVDVVSSKEEDLQAVTAQQQGLCQQLEQVGVTPFMARALVREFPATLIESQLQCLDARKPRSRPATLVKSIRENWLLPDAGHAPESPATAPKRPQLTPEEKAAREEKRLAFERKKDAAAHRALARLPKRAVRPLPFED